ncbi:hypothetical protein G6O67_002360 [Ophiocordyceps sinensis]|uniref:Uncharacterized protein n=1 Tax=Ophiocordyceps sinensis TaxID=72228 RepID=A0A8H4PU34_9HYPO|nr:hypothetical protein G6O67_002360 [Ophiocordyceps sinensis]
MEGYYDEDVDIHVRHGAYPPQPVRYVRSPPRPRGHYTVPIAPGYLVPEHHTTVVSRFRSRDRSRERPRPSPANPVIINNQFYREHSSDDDDTSDGQRRHSQLARRRRRHSSDSRSRSRSRSHSRSHSRSPAYKTRQEWEAERARRELEQLRRVQSRDREVQYFAKEYRDDAELQRARCELEHLRLVQSRDNEGQRLAKEYRDDADLQRAKRELDEIKGREARAEEERRIKKELDLKRLREEDEAAREKSRRDKEATEAVERYKLKEADRIACEEKQKYEYEKEYKRRLQEDLIKSGLDERAISAIVNKQKVPETCPEPAARPTYTRMARRHLSVETLRTFRVEYDIDSDPEYVLIKRWVPEWEQDQFWKHTRHRHQEPEFEWVRKKNDRKRSKSPALLMYLAGARPA